MWDDGKFLEWLSKGANMMNIVAQLRSEDVEIWGRIENTKEFEWDNGGGICYRGIVAIF